MQILRSLVKPQTRPANYVNPTFGFNGNQYPLYGWQGSDPRWPDSTYLSRIADVHEQSGLVAGAVEARALVLSQIRFEWDVSGERFPAPEMHVLSPSTTRPEFLKTLEYDVSYHGSAYVVRPDRELRRLRPDNVSVMLGSNSMPTWNQNDAQYTLPWDAEVVGLVHHPHSLTGSQMDPTNVTVFMPGEFRIWKPEPHPVNFWRGTSWVNSVIQEIVADKQAVDHTTKFFENAATPNLVFMMDPTKTPTEIKEFATMLNAGHVGNGKAFKNLFLGGGTDVKAVGSSMKDLELKGLTGGYETRVALRARVPGVILGISEGYAGSSLNAGNYGSARRMFADGWFVPDAESLCAAVEPLGRPAVPGAELTFDRKKVLLLQEDEKDAADIAKTDAASMRQLIDAGYDPDSVTEAIMTRDWSRLRHTGNVSVQLQPPGTGEGDDD